MDGIFKRLEQIDFFTDYVAGHFQSAPSAVIKDFPCKNTLSAERVKYSFGEYQQNIRAYAVLLHSENPDHYKRAGALLHALYKSKIISSISFHPSKDEVEAGFAHGINYGEAQELVRFPIFYEDYHNQLLSFDLCYQCCAAYEPQNPPGYDFGYLYNVCHYLWKNKDLTVDSLSMLFRSLMHRP
jgi:hypothetical protein